MSSVHWGQGRVRGKAEAGGAKSETVGLCPQERTAGWLFRIRVIWSWVLESHFPYVTYVFWPYWPKVASSPNQILPYSHSPVSSDQRV